MRELRRAAVRLHGLASADRAWVLARLEPDERSRIEPMLAELAALAPRPGHEWSDALGSPDPTGDARADAAGSSTASRRALEAADARRVAEALQGQPDSVVATLLVAGDWSWRDRFLKSLPKARRREIARRMRERGGALPPALRDAVTEAAAHRLGRSGPGIRRVEAPDAAVGAEAAPTPFWRRIPPWGR